MDKFIPISKQTKKQQKDREACLVQYYSKHRNTWNGMNPVTRTVPNGKGYDRNKQKQEDRRSGRCSHHEDIYRIFIFRISTFMIYCTQYLAWK